MELRVDRASPVSLGAQLERAVRTAIERGTLAPGDRLPSLRDVAARAGVNVNTVRAVYARLEAAGVVATEHGRGTFVAAPPAALRRELRDQIARLEAELVRLPSPPAPAPPRAQPPAQAGLLSTEELAAVRDELLARLEQLDAARAEVVQRLARLERAPAPARRSTPTLRGARVRWVPA